MKSTWKESSTSRSLRGTQYGGKKIRAIHKYPGTARGDFRRITYHDKSTSSVHKSAVAAMMRNRGTREYVEKFKGYNTRQKVEAVKKSIDRAASIDPKKYKSMLKATHNVMRGMGQKPDTKSGMIKVRRGKEFREIKLPPEYHEFYKKNPHHFKAKRRQ